MAKNSAKAVAARKTFAKCARATKGMKKTARKSAFRSCMRNSK